MSINSTSFEHFVYFTYKLEWKIPKEFEPQGYLSVFLPKSFPVNSQILRIPIEKRDGFFEKTIDACVDDFFIDCAIRKSFLHIVRYSKKDLKIVQEKLKNKSSSSKNKNNNLANKKSNNSKYQEKFTCESIFLDGGTLFIPNRKETSITVNMELFDFITFSIQIDEELLSIQHIKKFAPTILHINKIDSLFDDQIKFDDFNELTLNPIYFECQVGTNSYFLVPRYNRAQKTISIDATILISPRTDQSIVFRIYDKDEEITQSTFIGSGLYISKNQDLDEEEDYSEDSDDDKKQFVKSISEENLLPKGSQDKKKHSKSHHHHHHSKNKTNQNDESFIQMMKKVEEMSKYRPPIQFSSPIKEMPRENCKRSLIMTPVKASRSGRKSRIMADDDLDNNTAQKENLKENLTTEVLPIKQEKCGDHEFGYCQFYLFPERHTVMKMISSTNDDSYKNVTVSFDIYDPASRFPPPFELQEIKRPSITHKRPSSTSRTNQKEMIIKNKDQMRNKSIEKQQTQINVNNFISQNNEYFTVDNNLSKIFPENPKILAIEKPTIKLLRWILTCPRFSPVSLKLINFIQNFHKTTIHGYSHILNPCFKNCFYKSPDLITGFHFLSPKEEVFVLETRTYRPNKASLSLELFLRNEMPSDTHIIANNSLTYSAPRLYCCTDDLIQRVEIPIPLNDLLQINGLYFQKNENHKLFPIAQKLANLIQSKKSTEIAGSFPIFAEIKLLEKKASSLYATPVHKSLTIEPINQTKGADFGDFKTNRQDQQNLIKQTLSKDAIPEKERLTTYYLTKPNVSSYPKHRSESTSTRFMKKSVREEMNEGKDIIQNNSVNIKPPDDTERESSQKAPRNFSIAKQKS